MLKLNWLDLVKALTMWVMEQMVPDMWPKRLIEYLIDKLNMFISESMPLIILNTELYR